jgi:glycine/D-amino acid oxidase-like deaminating enzyme
MSAMSTLSTQDTLSRRTFLAALGAASAAGPGLAANAPVATVTTTPATIEADVLVVGGGTAGAIAAIQAGRLGARTVLVEAGSQLGGTLSTGGVDFPGLFHAWGRQVIAGIGWDLVTQTAALTGSPLPDFSIPTGRSHPKHQVRIHGGLYAALAEDACLKAGVQLRYYETPLAAVPVSGGGFRVRLAGKGLQADVAARTIVDCTGSATVAGMLGLPRLREEITQPGTLIYRLGGYDVAKLDLAALDAAAKTAVADGKLLSVDFRHSLRGFLAGGGENATHVPGADSSTSATHSKANVDGRQGLLRMVRFLKSHPGFEKLRIERLQPETGIRETYRIDGETLVTVDDYTSGRVFPDAVAHAFYPVDLHDEKGIRPRHLAEGVVPTIPLGALIPKGSRDILVAGRCISSDRLANSGLRVQAACMAMGQAAGAAAALAAKLGTTPAEVPLADLRRILRSHGAIVPGA